MLDILESIWALAMHLVLRVALRLWDISPELAVAAVVFAPPATVAMPFALVWGPAAYLYTFVAVLVVWCVFLATRNL